MRKKILSFLFLICFMGNQTEIQANEITIGIALGFTGPTESIVPSMASSAELAISEANSSKIFFNGEEKINLIKIDTMCNKSQIKTINNTINKSNISFFMLITATICKVWFGKTPVGCTKAKTRA